MRRNAKRGRSNRAKTKLGLPDLSAPNQRYSLGCDPRNRSVAIGAYRELRTYGTPRPTYRVRCSISEGGDRYETAPSVFKPYPFRAFAVRISFAAECQLNATCCVEIQDSIYKMD